MERDELQSKADAPHAEKKSGCLTKLVKYFFSFVGVVVVLWLVLFLVNDRSLKYVAINDVYDEVDYRKGEAPDYRAYYSALLEKDVLPVEENGWVEIFKACGPGSIEQQYSVDRTKWEDYGSTEASKYAYENSWAPLCEKLGLDPKEKPLFYDRLKLIPYLVKNGLTGAETAPELDPDDSDFGLYEYWENAESQFGKITFTAANDAYDRLRKAPWTAKDCPMAAQWFDENEDMMTVVAEAARKPKFHGQRLIPSPDDDATMLGMLLPDVQHMRELARLFQMRAHLRIGSGDISGAIDDVETIVSFARHLYDDESSLLVERLVGCACLGIAASTPFYANPDALPSAAETERIAALWRASYSAEGLAARNAATQRMEFMLASASVMDVTHAVGNGKLYMLRALGIDDLDQLGVYDDIGGDNRRSWLGSFIGKAAPINEPKICHIFRERYLELLDLPGEERSDKLEALLKEHKWYSCHCSETLALEFLGLLFPAFNAAEKAFSRVDCLFKMATVSQAIRAYVAANGTLPPAFTVDESGRPLHSWRVLILPYLGDDAKALYEQIRLDEPWDSEHNRAFYSQMPEVFKCSSSHDMAPGETRYSVLVAQDGLFDRSGVGKTLDALFAREGRDTAAQLIMVERANPICWMTPDAELDADEILAEHEFDPDAVALSDVLCFDVHRGGCNRVTLGGGVTFLGGTTTRDEILRNFLGVPIPENKDDEEGEHDSTENE